MKAGLDVAQIWLDGNETLVNTIDRNGDMLPISLIDGHAITHDPLVVLVCFILSNVIFLSFSLFFRLRGKPLMFSYELTVGFLFLTGE